MGLNLYLRNEYNKNDEEGTHIGKLSYGWRFLAHKTEDVYDMDSFLSFLDTGKIVDEYDREVSKEDLLKNIEERKDDQHHESNDGETDWFDFCSDDFC
jgi:hypothetical protein